MRCDDIYDRHDTSATPCTFSEAKNKLAVMHTILQVKISEKKQVYTKVKVISHI